MSVSCSKTGWSITSENRGAPCPVRPLSWTAACSCTSGASLSPRRPAVASSLYIQPKTCDNMPLCTLTHHILHLAGNLQGQVGRGATCAPGDIAERGLIACHPLLPIEEVLHALQSSQGLLPTPWLKDNEHIRNAGRTSSVRGGKNSKEKKVLPSLIDWFILSTIFILAPTWEAPGGP